MWFVAALCAGLGITVSLRAVGLPWSSSRADDIGLFEIVVFVVMWSVADRWSTARQEVEMKQVYEFTKYDIMSDKQLVPKRRGTLRLSSVLAAYRSRAVKPLLTNRR